MTFLRSAPGAEPVLIEGIFKAPVERVFQAWIDPDKIVKWFGARPNCLAHAEIDLRVGGAWCFTLKSDGEKTDQMCGEYLEIEKNNKLSFTWSHHIVHKDGTREATPLSQVTILFSTIGQQNEKTKLTLRHEAIVKESARLGVGHGWQNSFSQLEMVLIESSGTGNTQKLNDETINAD